MSPWRWWQRRQPVPPRNLRIVYPDGCTIPLECTYQGREHGLDVWVAVSPVRIAYADGMAVAADLMPARTAIALPVGVPPWSP